MKLARRPLLVLLLLATCAAISLAPVGRAADTAPILASAAVTIPDDPNSTFRAGNVSLVLPFDVVEVPIYLDTASQVAFFNCRLAWTQAHLDLVDVSYGPGAPAGSGMLTVDPAPPAGGGISFSYSTAGYPPLTIPAGSPVALLHVRVQCGFYFVPTPVDFYEDGGTADNFYTTSTGMPLAPRRQSGAVTTEPNWNYLMGTAVSALPRQGDVAVPLRWQHTLPGRPQHVVLQFDATRLSFVSVAPGPALPGATLTPVPGSGVVDIAVSSGMIGIDLPDDQMMTVHFAVLGDGDNYTTPLTFIGGTAIENLCGVVTPIVGPAGSITVPNHAADADIGDIGAYTTASYYDVPVTLDSNYPVHDFEFWATFPSSQLRFVQAVAVSPFPVPSISIDGGNPNLLNINAGSPPLPGDPVCPAGTLPAVVFKVRFAPLTPPTAGTVFPIQFQQPNPQNKVEYYIALGPPLVSSSADLTLHNGGITISTPPPPGCPTLYSWDGSSMRRENTLLAACDGVASPVVATDHYLMQGPVVPVDGQLRFQIREDETQLSEFQQLQLVAVDHAVDQPIQVTAEGQVIQLDQPYAVAWARTQSGEDVTALVQAPDGVDFASESSGWLDVSFGKVNPGELGADAAAVLASSRPKPPPPPQRDKAPGAQSPGSKLIVSVLAADGSWRRIAANDARLEQVQQATALDPRWIGADRELVLRYAWEGPYRVDVVEFRAAHTYTGERLSPRMLAAHHSKDGNVLDALSLGAKGAPVMLGPGQAIDVVFDAATLPALSDGMVRSYIFEATGRYAEGNAQPDAAPALRFALMPNVPNPFNPSTTIRFTLPHEARVLLTVHDLRGALVRTLVSGVEASGLHDVVWDGRSDSGKRVASGTYIYRIDTPQFRQSHKMVLVQ